MAALQTILDTRLIAVIRLDQYDRARELAAALVAGGVRVLEFTRTGAGVLPAIAVVRASLGDAVCVGVGSVLAPGEAADAIAAGAQFVVTPAVRPAVIERCRALGVAVMAGGLTPTELLAAHEAGADLVKLFPARQGGPAYLRDVLGPLPHLPLVPTGGVEADNAPAYLAAGARAVGIGGRLVDADAVARGDWAAITSQAARCAAACVQSAR